MPLSVNSEYDPYYISGEKIRRSEETVGKLQKEVDTLSSHSVHLFAYFLYLFLDNQPSAKVWKLKFSVINES